MRKSIVLGLLALAFGVFGSPAFAGNIEDCEFLKDKSHPDYAPGLYGLCVAWHNADEDAKDGLAEKFFDRANFDVPGSGDPDDPDDPQDFYCPCWSDVTFEDICALGTPISVVGGQVLFDGGITFEGFGGPSTAPVCAHTIQDADTNEYLLNTVIPGLDAESWLDCQAERDMIATLYMTAYCQ